MPSPFETVLLALAAWRIWQLLADDTIFDRPRRYITAKWKPLEDFIECPYCLGWHVSLVIYLFWLWLPTATIYVCIPFALNAVVVAINHWLTND